MHARPFRSNPTTTIHDNRQSHEKERERFTSSKTNLLYLTFPELSLQNNKGFRYTYGIVSAQISDHARQYRSAAFDCGQISAAFSGLRVERLHLEKRPTSSVVGAAAAGRVCSRRRSGSINAVSLTVFQACNKRDRK